MLNIALICQYGASTGMFASQLRKAGEKLNVDLEAKAYPDSKFEDLIAKHDVVLFGPQVGYKKEEAVARFPQYENKMMVIDSMDFGMMNGEKVLKDILKKMEETKDE